MFKKEEEKIDTVLHKLMQTNIRLSNGMQQNSIEHVWEKALGPTIAKYTSKFFIRNGILTVHISSASLRNELIYEKEKIISKLNKELEYKEINEVIIK